MTKFSISLDALYVWLVQEVCYIPIHIEHVPKDCKMAHIAMYIRVGSVHPTYWITWKPCTSWLHDDTGVRTMLWGKTIIIHLVLLCSRDSV